VIQLVIVASAVFSAASAHAQPADRVAEAQTLKQQADALVKEGKRQDAIPLYKKAITLNINFWQAHDALGNLYFKEKMFLDAAMEYGEAMVINPAYTAGYYNMAYAYRKAGRYGDAVKNYEKYIKLKPDDTDAYFGAAESYKFLGEKDKAIENYQLYIQKEQRPSEQKWVEKAKAALAELQGNAPPAVVVAAPPAPVPAAGAGAAPGTAAASAPLSAQSSPAELEPKPPPAPASAQTAYPPPPWLPPPSSPAPAASAAVVPVPVPVLVPTGGAASSVSVSAAAPAAAPAPAPAPKPQPQAAPAQPAPAAAQPAPAAAQPSPPPAQPPAPAPAPAAVAAVPPAAAQPSGQQNDPLVDEGDAHFKAGSYHNAITTYRDAIVRNPVSVEAHYKLGVALAMTNRLDAAVSEWQIVLQLDPNNVGAKENIAKAQAKQSGAPVQSPPAPAASVQSGPGVEDLLQSAIQANNRGDYQAAVGFTDELFKRKQDHPQAYVVRGDAMLGLGQMDDAVRAYNSAMVFDPTLSAPLFGLAEAYRLLANRDKSVHYYKLFLQSQDSQKDKWRVERAQKMIQLMEGP
jgi:tetratricopeptide (TPR) repeat protein